jgi:serine/threonine-protein kinase
MGLVAGALWLLGTVLYHLAFAAAHPGDPRWLSFSTKDAIAMVAAAASFALYLYVRRGGRDPEFILNLGLGYLIFNGIALALMDHPASFVLTGPIEPMVGWIGAVVLMAAAIAPTTPRKTLIASLIAVSMNPLAMLIGHARGMAHFGPAYNAFVMHAPDFLLAGVAVVISLVLTRLGRQVTRAREMGSYQIGELLGQGGMGQVYRARHRLLARPAAIKLIRPEVLGADSDEAPELAIKRFRREAEAAANLRSPHTVALYDFGVTEDNTFYFVMELLDGLDLESLVREHGPVPPNRTIHILRQVCDSLDEAHRTGLVHRDIKPANIHLGRVGLREDFVKVLDFGLVKPADGAMSDQSVATEAGIATGTPAYMAPEAALGEPVDGRADIYALGCVAYYLLTARMVFEADNAVQLIARHVRAAPVAPSKRSGIDLPPALDRIVLDCLGKTPEERPQTAADLERRLAAVPLAPWTEADAATWWASRRERSVVSPAGRDERMLPRSNLRPQPMPLA